MRGPRAAGAVSSCVRITALVTCAWLLVSVVRGAAYVSSQVSVVSKYLEDVTDLTDLVERPLVRQGINDLVKLGALASLTRNTLGRIHLTSSRGEGLGTGTGSSVAGDGDPESRFPKLQSLGVDVSHAGEASFVYDRFQRFLESKLATKRAPGTDTDKKEDITTVLGFTPLVLDVGANDGFLSSNSYNLVRWGWSSVLVEPNPEMLALAKTAQDWFVNPWRDGHQTGCYVNAAMAGVTQKETLRLKLGGDVVQMESALEVGDGDWTGGKDSANWKHASNARDAKLAKLRGGSSVGAFGKETPARYVDVDTLPIHEIATKCHLPTDFGLLSIDAEGVGDKVLREILNAGFVPRWILYEAMHNAEPFSVTKAYVEQLGWRYVRKIGWNHVFEREGMFEA